MASGEDLGDVARHLRVGMGAQFRAEAEEGERLAAQAALRRRGLAEVAAEARERGLSVTVRMPDQAFSGAVHHVARDLLTLSTVGGMIHVNLAASVVLRVGPASVGPPPPHGPDGASSFKARLYELEMAGAAVEVGTVLAAAPLRGCLRAVAVDHVLVDDDEGDRWAVALTAVRYVRSPAGPSWPL